MSGQPQIVGFWEFDILKVEALESGGVATSMIVNAGQTFELKVYLKLFGFGANAGIAPWFNPVGPVEGAKIEHYALNMETGALTTLPYKIPTAPASLIEGLEYEVTTGPYTTGAAMDLDLGTYQISTVIRLTTANLAGVEAAFFVSYLMVIAPPPPP